MLRLKKVGPTFQRLIQNSSLFHSPFASGSRRWLNSDPHRPLHNYRLVSVALVGPPNAGKSTLFNRLCGPPAKLRSDKKISGRLVSQSVGRKEKRQKQPPHVRGTAIVSDVAGTTRDRKSSLGQIAGVEFEVLDTAGIDARNDLEEWVPHALRQTRGAARQADLVFLLVDGRLSSLTADVWETAQWLRSVQTVDQDHPEKVSSPKVVVLVNKMEGMAFGDEPPIFEEAARLGFGDPVPISALHGEGMAEVAAAIQRVAQERNDAVEESPLDASTSSELSTSDPSPSSAAPLKLAIVGRINVGKSTLVNRLLRMHGDDDADDVVPRVLTGPTPGLTRDAIDLEFVWKPGRIVRIVDTAGIRKPSQYGGASSPGSSKVPPPGSDEAAEIERRAVLEAWHAVKTAEVAVLVLDAGAKLLQRQELAMCEAILREGRALVVAANKMDLVVEPDYSKEQFAQDVRTQLEERFPLLRKTPIIPLSASTGANAAALLPAVWDARERWQRRITTADLNRWVRDVQGLRPPNSNANANSSPAVRIKYAIQAKGRPPTFVLFSNADKLPDSSVRFLTRHFQDAFGLYGMEVRLVVKKSLNPFEGRARSPPPSRTMAKVGARTGANVRSTRRTARSR